MDNTINYTKTFSIDLKRKKYHDNIKKNRIIRLCLVLIVWALIAVFLLTPLSKVKSINAEGNVYIEDEYILNNVNIDKNIPFFLLDYKKIKTDLEDDEFISKVSISNKFNVLTIKINEIYPVAEIESEYLLSNGSLIKKNDYPYNDLVNHVPSLNSDLSTNLRVELGSKLSMINIEILNKMEDINLFSKGIEGKIYYLCDIEFYDEKVGYFILRMDLPYLNNKLEKNNYDFITNEIENQGIISSKENPLKIRYDLISINEFIIVDSFS